MTGLIIVVNYNQEMEIARFLQALGAVNHGLDVIVVDDGSTDRSPSIATEHGYAVIRRPTNQGVGAAIRTGIQHAVRQGRYEYVVIMSSNGKMLPSEIPVVITPILDDRADYVQGSRFRKGGHALSLSAFRSLGIPTYSLIASVLLRRRFTDITCGFRAYRLWILKNEQVNLDQSWLNQYEAELYIHYYACRLKARIVEVPVTIDYSHLAPGRKSKMTPVSGWWSLFRPFLLLSSGLKR
jgi:glycosyltransferase involved in cell wall biosynthesis